MASAAGDLVTQLFAKYSGTLHDFLAKRLRASDEADDFIQEIYLRLLRRQAEAPIEEPLALLYVIAKQVAWKHSNKAEKRPLATDHETLDELACLGQDLTDDEMVTHAYEEREWDHYMGLLQETHRTVVDLKYREGLTTDEIAAKLDIPPWKVKRYLRQAFKTFKEHRTRGLY